MRINNINSMGFNGIYERKDTCFNEKERAIADDIRNKLGQPKPDDSKNRTYETWLEQEQGINILFSTNQKKRDRVIVTALKGAYDSDKNVFYPAKGDFHVGDYFDTNQFDFEDVIKEEKANNFLEKMFHPMTMIGIMLLGIIFPVLTKRPQAEKVVTNPEIKKELIQAKDSIVDSLKNAKPIKF